MAWYPLNGDLKDYVGGNDLLNSNSSVIVSNSNGKIGKCYEDLTTSWACLEAKDPIQLPQTHSMFCWVCPEVLTSDCSLDGVLGNHNYNIPANTGITLRYVSATTYRVSLNTANTNRARTYNTYYGDTLLNINEWHHIGFTYDGTTIKLYVDGKLDKTVSYSDMNLTSEKFRIFSWSNFNGNDYCGKKKINDVRIYDHCLSEAEVKEISKAKILHYKFESVYGNKNLINTSRTFSGYSTAFTVNDTAHGGNIVTNTSNKDTYCFLRLVEPLEENEYYTLSFNCSKIQSDSNITYAVDNNISVGYTMLKTGRNSITFQCTSAMEYKTEKLLFDDKNSIWGENQQNYTLSKFKLEKGKVNTPYCPNSIDSDYDSDVANIIYDISGYENNGEKVGNIFISSDTTINNSSVYFKDNTAYIEPQITLGTEIQNNFTISYWAKNSNIDGKMTWGFSDGNRLNIFPTQGYFCCNTGDSASNPYQDVSGNTISYNIYNNKWTYYVITADGTNNKIYINGEYKGKAKYYRGITGTKMLISGWDTSISSGYRWIDGNIADFKIYATVLSDEDIQREYKERLKVDNIGNVYCSELNEEERVIEYLESTGTQYIDTGISPSPTIKWELKVMRPTSSYIYNGSFSSNQRFRVDDNSYGMDGAYWLAYPAIGATKTIIWDATVPEIYQDGIGSGLKYTTFSNNFPIYLFAQNSGNSSINFGKSRIYYSKIWDNGVLVRDFLPAISTEDGHIGEPCLFDMVENKYYYNQGTGIFLTNLPESINNVNVTETGILNCRYLIEGNDPAKVLKDENIVKVNKIKEN